MIGLLQRAVAEIENAVLLQNGLHMASGTLLLLPSHRDVHKRRRVYTPYANPE